MVDSCNDGRCFEINDDEKYVWMSNCPIVQGGTLGDRSAGTDQALKLRFGWFINNHWLNFWWILDNVDNDLEPYQAFTYILAYFVAGHCLDEDQNNQEVELYTCSGATWQVFLPVLHKLTILSLKALVECDRNIYNYIYIFLNVTFVLDFTSSEMGHCGQDHCQPPFWTLPRYRVRSFCHHSLHSCYN